MGDSENSSSETVYTILIVGNSRVGKSSLIHKHFDEDFSPVYFPTNEISRYVSYAKSYGKLVKLIVWDVNGDAISGSRNNINKYDLYKISNLATQPQGIFFVYDITNEKSFLDISKWITCLEGIYNGCVQRTLLGNKADCWKERVVSSDMGQAMANLHQMRFFETSVSSKTDTNIKSAFCMMVHDVRKQYDKDFAMRFENEEEVKKKKMSRRKRLLKFFNVKKSLRLRGIISCSCCRKPTSPIMMRMDELNTS